VEEDVINGFLSQDNYSLVFFKGFIREKKLVDILEENIINE